MRGVCVCVCAHVNVFLFVCVCIPVYGWWVQVSVWCVYLPVVWPSLIPSSYLGSRLGATFPQVWSGITRLFDDKHFRWRNLLCAKVLYSRDRKFTGRSIFHREVWWKRSCVDLIKGGSHKRNFLSGKKLKGVEVWYLKAARQKKRYFT